MIGEQTPRNLASVVSEWITASLREPLERAVALGGDLFSPPDEVDPELPLLQDIEAVVFRRGIAEVHAAETGDLGERQDTGLDGRDPPREAVSPGLDAKRRAAGDQGLCLGMVDEKLELWRPVLQVLHLVEHEVGLSS